MPKRKAPIPQLSSDTELADYLLKHVGDNLREAIKATVSVMIKVEMEHVRAELVQQTGQQLVFNGSYHRHLTSPVGKVENIPIARFRSGNTPHDLQTLQLFDEEKARFFDLVGDMHLSGISQRKIDKLCRRVLGIKAIPQATKQVFEELIEQECFQVNEASLLDAPYEILLLDGIWSTVKLQHSGETRKQVVLTALGMSADGSKKKILGMQLAFEEDEASWKELLESLTKRGLNMQGVHLAVCDDASGLLASLERLHPNLKIQLCLCHRYRNVLKHTPYKLKKEMGKDLRALTQSTSKEAFLNRVKELERRWHTIAPRAITSLKHRLEYSTAYFSFDPSIWSKIRTTNAIDRTFREVRRRTSIHDDHYESPDSMKKYHQAILGNLNRTYFNTT